MLQSHLLIGEITKPQGVRGELKLRPITCDPSRFEGLETAYVLKGEEYVPVSIRVTRVGEDAIFLYMDGVNDRNDAEKMRGIQLFIDREHAVELDEDSNFLCDLIGLQGIDDEGNSLGRLDDVLQPGGNDVYVFHGPRGEVLVPALKIVVLKVDLEKGEMLLSAQRLREVAVFEDDEV